MPSWKLKVAAATVGVAWLFTAAHSEPLNPASVPGDSKWVVHIDMDSVKKSTAWKEVYDRIQKQPDFVPRVTELEGIFNARFPDDLHGITLFGANFGGKTGVVLIDANVDRKQVEGLLAQAPKTTSTPRGDHAVLSWDDKGETKFGAFFNENRLLISDDKDSVGLALDVLDGKAKSLKIDTPLMGGVAKPEDKKNAPGIMIYIAGEELGKLRKAQAQSPLLAQMKSAWITLQEDQNDVILRLSVTADTAESAIQMRQGADGLRAILNLQAGAADAKPGLKKLNDVVQRAVLAANGTNVSLETRIPLKDLPGALDEAMKNRK